MVNGTAHVLGSDKAAIERAIAQTRKTEGMLSLPVGLAVTDGKLNVNVPAARGGAPRSAARSGSARSPSPLRSRSRAAKITAASITYHNVVRRWMKLGEWAGKGQSWNVPLADFALKDKNKDDKNRISTPSPCWCSAARAASPGLMLGAAMVALK